MARKSSKTAHVMNLLAGEESESSKSEAAKENLAASLNTDSSETIKELTVLAHQASIQTQEGPLSPSPISIIDMSSNAPDPVSELIRQQLEDEEGFISDTPEEEIIENKKEIESGKQDEIEHSLPVTDNVADEEASVISDFYEGNDSSPVLTAAEVKVYTNPSTNVDDANEGIYKSEDHAEPDKAILNNNDKLDSDNEISNEYTKSEIIDFDINNNSELKRNDTIKDDTIQSKSEKNLVNNNIVMEINDSILEDHAEFTSMECNGSKEDHQVSAPKAPTYQYLNVMENVVKSMVDYYVGKFDTCTCGRCIADITALTLTKLPPKYIVVESNSASPLLNFYINRYSQQVIVELTKSCSIVKQNPHH